MNNNSQQLPIKTENTEHQQSQSMRLELREARCPNEPKRNRIPKGIKSFQTLKSMNTMTLNTLDTLKSITKIDIQSEEEKVGYDEYDCIASEPDISKFPKLKLSPKIRLKLK